MTAAVLPRVLTDAAVQSIDGPPVAWRVADSTTELTRIALETTTVQSVAHAAVVHEKLIGDNNLKPVSYLMWAFQIASSVALIQVPGRGTATGFLIGADILLTNNHVLRNAADAAGARARFNYQLDRSGQLEPSETFRVAPEIVFYTNVALDFTIVGVADAPGHRYGVIPVGRAPTITVGDGVTIIQHPLGQPKQIAMVDNEIKFADATILQYLTDTLPGSSGSPIFNSALELVGLHHSGGWIPEPSTGSTHFRNEGITIAAIVNDLAGQGLA